MGVKPIGILIDIIKMLKDLFWSRTGGTKGQRKKINSQDSSS
jgi:hypothetical protein